MLNYDFSPFYRSTIGFDRLLSMLDKHAGPDTNGQSYPPYNIERTGENAYRITLAVAGFCEFRTQRRNPREHFDRTGFEGSRREGRER